MKFFCLIGLCFPLLASAFTFHRSEELNTTTVPFAGRTSGEKCDDIQLVNRIIAAYRLAEKSHLGDSHWQRIYENCRLQEIHTIFQAGNLAYATEILRHPGKTDLFYGFEGLCHCFLPMLFTYEGLVSTAGQSLDCLLRCGESIGAIRLDYPESYGALHKRWAADEVLETIEKFLGISVQFPNPYPDEAGVCTSHGVASYRAIQALYQAYRIKELVKHIPHPRVLEIGAGLGRTAYYCKQFGIMDYTIIDIPMTLLASSYFLGRTLGEDQVVLLGESQKGAENKVKLLTPDQFLSDIKQYDLIVNVDSLTEMDSNTIRDYLNKIQKNSPLFLSINHEVNRYTVYQLLSSSPHLEELQRYPYWMRLGYAEELYKFKKD